MYGLATPRQLQVASACGGPGLTVHRGRRAKVVLPRDDLEDNFDSKVLAHVRHRRACQPAAEVTPRGRPSSSRCNSRFLSDACLPLVHAERWARSAQRAAEAAAPPLERAAPIEDRGPPEPDMPAVVESLRSTMVMMEEGEVEHVPPRTWLVLEDPFEETDWPMERRLSLTAGAGFIQEASSMALRLVPPARLSARAAEANFRRASNGASLVALRHATLALGFFGRTEPTPKPGFIPMASLQEAPPLTSEELLARARRVSAIVACQAAAASRRQQQQRDMASARAFERMQIEASLRPEEMIPGKSSLQKGFQQLNDFMSFMVRRYGNPVRAWFMLDTEENMKLGQKQFERRCTEIAYRGQLSALWKYIDGDGSGTIGITEFHPPSAQLLAGFKVIMKDQFDDSLEEFFAFLDVTRRGRLNKTEFMVRMNKVGYTGPSGRLFDLLDKRNVGTISEKDLGFMQRWRPPPFIFSSPDNDALREVKRRFLEMYPTPLRVWRRCLDRNNSMSLAWEEFADAIADLCRRTKTPQYPEQVIASIWRALDTECTGNITLREWDLPSFEAIREFKLWADRVHGGVVKAFRALDSNSGNAKLSEGEILKAARGDDPCRADLDLIFEGLDVNDSRALTESDVRFLDTWDLSWEEWLHQAKQGEKTLAATTGSSWRRGLDGAHGGAHGARPEGFASTS